MRFSDLYSGLRDFSDDDEIVSAEERSKNFDAESENLRNATKIQLFDTSTQRSYLVSTGKRVYKILDDRRLDRPKISWSRKIDQIFDGQNFKGTLKARSERSYNLIVDAAPKRNNLVSKKLFANISFEDAVAKLKQRED